MIGKSTILAAALLLASCAGTPQGAPAAPAEKSTAGPIEQIGDQIVEATTPDERRLRLCLVIVTIAELQIHRAMSADPESAEAALGNLRKLEGAIRSVRVGSGLWLNADIAHAVISLDDVIIEAGLARGLSFAPQIAAPDPISILGRARLVASQSYLGLAMLRDAVTIFEGLRSGSIVIDDAWAACDERLDLNGRRIEGMLGLL